MNAAIRTALGILALTFAYSLPARAGLEDVRAAAMNGDAQMQLELGELYEFGFHLAQNNVPALAWYLIAAEQGNPKAAARGESLKARMTPEQVAEAEREAARLRAGVRKVEAQAPAPEPAAVPVAAPAN